MNGVKRLVPIPEARQVLGGIGHTTMYDLIKRREVVKVNLGRRSFVTAESLAALVDRLTEAAADASDADMPALADHMKMRIGAKDGKSPPGVAPNTRSGGSTSAEAIASQSKR